ncbi:RRQRL motif-containing zinc-binding protein [Streptomyces sp. NPDC002078]
MTTGIPVYRWHLAPERLATVRQLRALGLRAGGRDVAARSERPRRRRAPLVACLYSIEQPKPVRPTRPAKWATPAEANAARRRYPECGRDAECVIPPSLGMCVPCAHPEEQRAT